MMEMVRFPVIRTWLEKEKFNVPNYHVSLNLYLTNMNLLQAAEGIIIFLWLTLMELLVAQEASECVPFNPDRKARGDGSTRVTQIR